MCSNGQASRGRGQALRARDLIRASSREGGRGGSRELVKAPSRDLPGPGSRNMLKAGSSTTSLPRSGVSSPPFAGVAAC